MARLWWVEDAADSRVVPSLRRVGSPGRFERRPLEELHRLTGRQDEPAPLEKTHGRLKGPLLEETAAHRA